MAYLWRVRAASEGWTGSPGLNTFYFRQGAGEVEPENNSIAQLGADRVRAAFFELVNTFPINHIVTVDPIVDVIEDDTGDLHSSWAVDAPDPTVGLAISGFQGIALMLLGAYHTAGVVDGRKVAGRAFIGPVAEQQDTNGTPNADQLAKMALWAGELLAPGPTGPDLVVWSRPKYELPLADPPVLIRAGSSHKVTTITTRDFYAVLRSRRD